MVANVVFTTNTVWSAAQLLILMVQITQQMYP